MKNDKIYKNELTPIIHKIYYYKIKELNDDQYNSIINTNYSEYFDNSFNFLSNNTFNFLNN
jgi:hypothetical protein